MAFWDLVIVNYKLLEELTYLKINDMPIIRELHVPDWNLHRDRRESRKKFWLKMSQEGLLEMSCLVMPLKFWIIDEFSLFWFHAHSSTFGARRGPSCTCLLQRVYWSCQGEYSDPRVSFAFHTRSASTSTACREKSGLHWQSGGTLEGEYYQGRLRILPTIVCLEWDLCICRFNKLPRFCAATDWVKSSGWNMAPATLVD